MSDRVCTRCGFHGGAYWMFRKDLRESWSAQVAARRDARTAPIHARLSAAGVYPFITGIERRIDHTLFPMALFDAVAFVATIVHQAAHPVLTE